MKIKCTIQKKNKNDVDSLEEDQKEFINNNKQQRFKSERHNVFTKEDWRDWQDCFKFKWW